MPTPTVEQLASEISTDPAGLRLPILAQQARDHAIAAVLNLVRQGVSYEVFRGSIESYEIINATNPAEWTALSSAEKQRYQTIVGAGKVDTSSANVRAAFLAMFAAGTTTRTALIALGKRQGSRAEVLWGPDTTITPEQVGAAR